VLCSPELTAILHRHLATRHSTGRLFWGTRRGSQVPSSVYGRVWTKAREAAFTSDVVASPLVKRPYDLRHAAVSTWLNAGVEATRVAELTMPATSSVPPARARSSTGQDRELGPADPARRLGARPCSTTVTPCSAGGRPGFPSSTGVDPRSRPNTCTDQREVWTGFTTMFVILGSRLIAPWRCGGPLPGRQTDVCHGLPTRSSPSTIPR
jgi:hypothetical protein